MELLTILAIVGVVVGVISNLLPILGSTAINFIVAAIIASTHQGLQAMGSAGLPAPIVVFAMWYFVGTFGIKLLQFIPIPIVREVAQLFAGDI